MTVEKVDKQRDVVRNELRQSVENAPYGKADEMVFKLLFPRAPLPLRRHRHPPDLEAANVTNVKDFFATSTCRTTPRWSSPATSTRRRSSRW